MGKSIQLQDIDTIYPQWINGEFKLYDGFLEVETVGKRSDKDGVTYLVHWVTGDYRFGVATDTLDLVPAEAPAAADAPAPEAGAPDPGIVRAIRGRSEATHLDYPHSRAVVDVGIMLREYDTLKIEAQANGDTAMQWKGLFESKRNQVDELEAETERLRAALAAAESVIARIGELHPYSTTYHAFDQYHTEIGDIVSDYADKQARQDAG